ncbi:TetR/AcrR family transcriptional regulator [Deinococcus ruber]|uniref:TetR family transcriptional regulator n=1 Tax=Deinococcus ruber TaxID=1848197 RepID=A0A918F3A6_9DEIO|nr:TetR/AcrR family transcriptional regulator [Deinococcus ruber]GGQ97431.1 TetR family transcriptional regulator [Deinococcus ruber]
MPYPAKTSAEQILAAAVDLLERSGIAGLTLRALAADLKLTPNALYRYYDSRDTLLAAVAVQGARLLLEDIRAALSQPGNSLTHLAQRYLAFAHTRPALYDLYMTCDTLNAEQRAVYDQLWELVVGQLQPLAGGYSPDLTMTLWSYLHGLVGLERSGVYDSPGSPKPPQNLAFGLGLLLAGLEKLNPTS